MREYTYGLLGRDLQHSYSKQIHEALFGYRYDLIPLEPMQLVTFLRQRAFHGVNVTIPYKKDALRMCDELSKIAKRSGSVNTILKKESGVLWGDNTDYVGFLQLAEQAGISFDGKTVLVLGSGGSGETIRLAVADQHAREVVTVSRTGPVTYQHLQQWKHADIIINATPVGMHPHTRAQSLDLAAFPNCNGVIDIIYNPMRTRLLQQAQARGIPYANGLYMLVAQAARSGTLFSGKQISASVIRKMSRAIRREKCNLVLIGMPGSGKTAIGERLAERLSRPFLDTDAILAQQTGKTAAQLIQTRGEAAFRDLEREVVAQCARMTGVVIATGGGAVLQEENILMLRQGGWVVWLKREVSQLPDTGRPLSQGEGALQTIWKARKPRYAAGSDVVIENMHDLQTTVDTIQEAWDEAFDY